MKTLFVECLMCLNVYVESLEKVFECSYMLKCVKVRETIRVKMEFL